MAMPEAAMDEYTNSQFRYYNVRISREVFLMKTESVSISMKKFSNDQFRARIFSPDVAHHSGARYFVDDIHSKYLAISVVL